MPSRYLQVLTKLSCLWPCPIECPSISFLPHSMAVSSRFATTGICTVARLNSLFIRVLKVMLYFMNTCDLPLISFPSMYWEHSNQHFHIPYLNSYMYGCSGVTSNYCPPLRTVFFWVIRILLPDPLHCSNRVFLSKKWGKQGEKLIR